MMISDLFQETYSAITANKARSSLTILGIIIGIGSVIAMVAIGQGAQNSIQSSIQSIGSNLIMVMPGFSRNSGVSAGRGSAQTLTIDDADAIKSEIESIANVAPEISKRYQVTAKGNNTNTSIVGTVPSYTSVKSLEITSGAFISDQNSKTLAKVAVIAPSTRDDLFGEDVDPVGQSITINKIAFKIIGITKSKGGTGMGNQDDMVYIPLTTAQRYLSNGTTVSTINIQASSQESLANVQQEVTALLLKRHKIKDATLADFQIMNQADIVATASSVTSTFTLLLAAIAGISLVVGGIGIMNMMLTSVTERTREIGLRKAIGAKRNDVSTQFLMESVMLTFIGGIIGVFVGWLAATAVTKFASIATTVSTSSIFLAFGVSAAIGIIFGYYPARSASKLNPIDALRYE